MTNRLTKQATATTGWNAGANSLATVTGNQQAKITLVAGAGGIITGLSAVGATLDYNSVAFGFLAVHDELIQVIESGAVKATSTITFTADTVVTVTVFGTAVLYQIGSWSYVSSTLSGQQFQQLVVLYAPGDATVDPSLVSYIPASLEASVSESLTVGDVLYAEPLVYGQYADTLAVSAAFVGNVVIQAAITEFLTALDAFYASSVLQAMLLEKLGVKDTAGAGTQALLQYATNILSGATTRYHNFEFLGFCRVGMETYGYKADGLYKIGGDSDDGDLLGVLVEFAAENFGTQQGKRLEAVYLGLSTDGQVYVRMTDDTERQVTYVARQRKSTYRSDMQNGISSRYWRMRVEIVDASAVEIDNVEWVVTATGRRTST